MRKTKLKFRCVTNLYYINKYIRLLIQKTKRRKTRYKVPLFLHVLKEGTQLAVLELQKIELADSFIHTSKIHKRIATGLVPVSSKYKPPHAPNEKTQSEWISDWERKWQSVWMCLCLCVWGGGEGVEVKEEYCEKQREIQRQRETERYHEEVVPYSAVHSPSIRKKRPRECENECCNEYCWECGTIKTVVFRQISISPNDWTKNINPQTHRNRCKHTQLHWHTENGGLA